MKLDYLLHPSRILVLAIIAGFLSGALTSMVILNSEPSKDKLMKDFYLTENAIHNIYLYKVAKKNPALDEFAELLSQGSVYTEKLIAHMEIQKCTPEFSEIKTLMHDLEDKGDDVFALAISRLFTEEKDPIAVIKEKDILECLENVLDKYKKVSDIIEGILVKSS